MRYGPIWLFDEQRARTEIGTFILGRMIPRNGSDRLGGEAAFDIGRAIKNDYG